MDFFERLGDTIRELFDEDTSYQDSDFRHAWDELNDYLDENTGSRTSHGSNQSSKPGQFNPRPVDGLVKDYRNLELAPGADAAQVRQAYRKLLVKYHPDRHAANAGKQKIATEITAKLNESYNRIMQHLGEK